MTDYQKKFGHEAKVDVIYDMELSLTTQRPNSYEEFVYPTFLLKYKSVVNHGDIADKPATRLPLPLLSMRRLLFMARQTVP